MAEEVQVFLQCIKEGSKLRVKITSPGFFRDANCMFPKAIRVAGRRFSVPMSSVTFVEGPGRKYFYRINKNNIKIIDDNTIQTGADATGIKKIYEDESSNECMICMSADKDVVFANCGHYICCSDCSNRLFQGTRKCPVCRTTIFSVVKREDVQV